MRRQTWILALVTVTLLSAQAQEPPPEPTPEPEAAAPAQPAAPPALRDIRQVQIRAWIYEINEQGLRDLGANMTYTRQVNGVESPTGSLQQVNTSVINPLNPAYTVTLPTPSQTHFPGTPMRPDNDSATPNLQTQSGAGLTFSIIADDRGTIEGVFRSTQRRSDIDLVAKPELLVSNAKPATIHAGGEVPYQDLKYDRHGRPQLNVQWQPIGVKMTITPHIQPDNDVLIDLTELEVSDIARIDEVRGMDLPVFSRRRQAGKVRVPNGRTLIIGGLSSEIVRKSEQRVPFVGRVPIIGIPFRGRKTEADKSHLLIFLSPTIVDIRSMGKDMVKAMEFWRAETWRNTERIEQEVEKMEGRL